VPRKRKRKLWRKIIPVGKSFLSLRRLRLPCLPCCSSPSLEGLLLYSSTLLFRNWGGPAISVTKQQQQQQNQIQQRRGKFENWKGDKSHGKLVTSEKASNAEGRPEAEGGLGRWSNMDLSPREGWPTAAAGAGASSSECSRSELLVWSWSGSSSAEE